MKRSLRHYPLLALGWALVVIGTVGLFLPPFPALLVLAIGLILLGRRSPRVRLAVRRLARRYPAFGGALVKARARVSGWRQRRGGAPGE